MIDRKIENIIREMSNHFPVISLVGPRQSGKTTLVKKIFQDFQYINLENTQNRRYALEDPQGFIKQYHQRVIIDEAQYAPELFSYIQENVDETRINGNFVLTGSQNFLMSQNISQSLAGRTAVFTLHPFSYQEIRDTDYQVDELDELLFKGLYPRIYNENLNPGYWYPSYLSTYLERDVRNIKNVTNLSDFQRFLRICASRTGQVVNFSSLAVETGVSHPTVKAWLSVLESSHVIYLLPPYYKNYNKRLVKSPKLYFLDTGLVCSLLGISDKNQLINHFMKGPLFETFVISELIKDRANRFQPVNLYYWRDNVGNEIDCIQEEGDSLRIIEIKSGATINPAYFKAFRYFDKIDVMSDKKYNVIYGGEHIQRRTNVTIKGWKNMFD
jgi:predicted AAA+ superfamily ATPase